ncbi:608_t:CDS:2 [Scutellospora calospora]|uniref:608_t:CDS:1 n=1 Tax=Scutellospora calospora TaxID=85575 RepID=A0ACA9L162_9GLOM|nr:608_t:CDS:2 [Scutellospora calospora]
MKTKQVCVFSTQIGKAFNSEVLKFYNIIDQLVLQEVRFNVLGKNYLADYRKRDSEKENQSFDLFTKVIDKGPISQDAFRYLAALQPELLREYNIANTRKRINEEMSKKVSIFILDIDKPPDIDIDINQEFEEVLKYIGKADYRQIADIMLFIIPDLIKRNILNTNNSIINARISDDGRNVSKKIKHVMITFTILDDISNVHNADYHYTIILYPGSENYDMLKKVLQPISDELYNLTTNRLIDSNSINWKVKFHFSSDWKFMAIILGFNTLNSNYFCPWCLCTKKDIGNKDKVYKIERSMDLLKLEFFNNKSQISNLLLGQLKIPFLMMIPLDCYVPDELYIMLRIWDHLWLLVIQELRSET